MSDNLLEDFIVSTHETKKRKSSLDPYKLLDANTKLVDENRLLKRDIRMLKDIIERADNYIEEWQNFPHTNCTTHNELRNLSDILKGECTK